MFRTGLIDLLLDNPMSVAEIARKHDMQIKEVAIDVEHLRKSLRRSGHSLEVTPARCRSIDAGSSGKALRLSLPATSNVVGASKPARLSSSIIVGTPTTPCPKRDGPHPTPE
jgi:predicted Zn-ribbon and HTH transcriptional regulator